MDTNTDPQAEAQALLRATPADELLTKAYALTHRMHAATDLNVSADLRATRDMITAELERRATPPAAEAVRKAISDAYYDARNTGRTMEQAADDATAAVQALA